MLKSSFKKPNFALFNIHKVLSWSIFPFLVKSIHHFTLFLVNHLNVLESWATNGFDMVVLLVDVKGALWVLNIVVVVLGIWNFLENWTVVVHVLSWVAIAETLFVLKSSQVHLAAVIVDTRFLWDVFDFYVKHFWHIYYFHEFFITVFISFSRQFLLIISIRFFRLHLFIHYYFLFLLISNF